VTGERETLDALHATLDAAANALAPALMTREKATLAALHATLDELATACTLVAVRLKTTGGPA
jgi:hypothetical protein